MSEKSAFFKTFFMNQNAIFEMIRDKKPLNTAALDPGFQKGPFNYLTFAAFFGNIDVVRAMNEKGSSWESGLDGMNALHLATLNDHAEIVDYLLKNFQKRNPNSTCDEELTALHIACRERSNSCLHILLNFKKFDINAQSKGGFTPLHFAAFNNNVEAVKLLLLCKAKIDITDCKGRTPLDLNNGSFLLNFIIDSMKSDSHEWLNFIFNLKPIAINIKQEDTGNNILHLCVLHNAVKCLQICMQRDEKKKYEKNNKGETPLFMEGSKIIQSRCQQTTPIFNILAGNHDSYNKYIDEPDNRGYTILLESIEKGCLQFATILVHVYRSKIIKLIDNEKVLLFNWDLINKEALLLKDQKDESLFYTAVRTKNYNAINFFLNLDKSFDVSFDGPHETTICFLADKRNNEYISILNSIAAQLTKEEKFNAPNQNHETPLQISLKSKNFEAFKIIATRNREFTSILPELCSSDENCKFIEYLLQGNLILVNNVDPVLNKTMLHIACENNCTEIVKLLMSKGACPYIKCNETTLLHILAKDKSKVNLMRIIFFYPWNFRYAINIKNNHNLTAFRIAAIENNIEVVSLFLKLGAPKRDIIHLQNLSEQIKNMIKVHEESSKW